MEIGGAYGYSAIWHGTCCAYHWWARLTSLEIDPKLIEIAQQNVEEAGLVDMLERH